jgi:hypothetical protein
MMRESVQSEEIPALARAIISSVIADKSRPSTMVSTHRHTIIGLDGEFAFGSSHIDDEALRPSAASGAGFAPKINPTIAGKPRIQIGARFRAGRIWEDDSIERMG